MKNEKEKSGNNIQENVANIFVKLEHYSVLRENLKKALDECEWMEMKKRLYPYICERISPYEGKEDEM